MPRLRQALMTRQFFRFRSLVVAALLAVGAAAPAGAANWFEKQIYMYTDKRWTGHLMVRGGFIGPFKLNGYESVRMSGRYC